MNGDSKKKKSPKESPQQRNLWMINITAHVNYDCFEVLHVFQKMKMFIHVHHGEINS